MRSAVSIEVSGVGKSFHISDRHRSTPLPTRLRNPISSRRGRDLEVLRDISFEVRQGEFFGIVGRNGSGKSTLLKLLASIYRPDRGRIRIAGRLAPFLELGVGFNPQLPAFDNVVMNGVMMGLSSREAKARYEEIIEFAGLEDYTDLKLKNYSSGMRVRLGFSVMIHVDADVLLIDEVLAVGDAEFQERCGDVFSKMHKEGRTIVLVTHSMESMSMYCTRAMLIDEGYAAALGDPNEVANRYVEANMRASMKRSRHPFAAQVAGSLADPWLIVDEAWLEDSDGRRTTSLGTGEAIEFHAEVQVLKDIRGPGLFFHITSERGQVIFRREQSYLADGPATVVEPGERIGLRLRIENRLTPGRYVLSCAGTESLPDGSWKPAGRIRSVAFEVTGEEDAGLVKLEHEVEVDRKVDAEVMSR